MNGRRHDSSSSDGASTHVAAGNNGASNGCFNGGTAGATKAKASLLSSSGHPEAVAAGNRNRRCADQK